MPNYAIVYRELKMKRIFGRDDEAARQTAIYELEATTGGPYEIVEVIDLEDTVHVSQLG